MWVEMALERYTNMVSINQERANKFYVKIKIFIKILSMTTKNSFI